MTAIPPDEMWLTRFATRLLRLKPELSALEAVMIGEEQYETVSDLDPAKAADAYFKESAGSE